MSLNTPKIILLAIWFAIIVNLVLPFSPTWLAKGLYGLGIFFVLAHIAEFIIFRKVIEQKPDSTAKALAMTMLFGIFYIKG